MRANIDKKKAIELIEQKIESFEKIKTNATYETMYNEDYYLAFKGTEKLLIELFDKEENILFKDKVEGIAAFYDNEEENPDKEFLEYRNLLTKCIGQLKVYKESINNFWIENKTSSESKTNEVKKNKMATRIKIPPKIKAQLQKEINSICPFCKNEDVGHFEIHHIDNIPSNNNFENLLLLCPICHSKITKGDISVEEVRKRKQNLSRIEMETEKSNFSANTLSVEGNIKDSIVANSINAQNIILKGKRKPKIEYPIGCIGSDLNRKNYVKYLIDRYNEFIKEDEYKGKYKFAIIWNAIKKEFKADTYFIPTEKFESVTYFVQNRILKTRIGRIRNGQGFPVFSTFEEYKKKTGIQ